MTYFLLLIGLAAILLVLGLMAVVSLLIAATRRTAWKAGYMAGREAAWTAHEIAQRVLGESPTRGR